MSITEDSGPIFDGVRIGRPATGALLRAGYHVVSELPEDLEELLNLHGVGPRAIHRLRQCHDTMDNQ